VPRDVRPLSVTDLFSIGIGPSSSHTVGPMKAAGAFARELREVFAGCVLHPEAVRIHVELFGSLGATGRGHATDRAVVWGLAGYRPRTVPADVVSHLYDDVAASGRLDVAGLEVGLVPQRDIELLPQVRRPEHVNTLALTAYDGERAVLQRTYCSVGGGFVTQVRDGAQVPLEEDSNWEYQGRAVPHPFTTGAQLIAACKSAGVSVSELVRANEETFRPRQELDGELDAVWEAMDACIDSGLQGEGTLPGGLGVPRRAGKLHRELLERAGAGFAPDPLEAMDWVNLFALAVNEENASGHRVVTAPTNGAAGVIPAVLRYYMSFVAGADSEGVRRFLLAATAVGTIIKTNASIAGAEVGCQGEVGSASAMAAAGLAEVLGGSPEQVENAAEIAMEHNLGLTCDPIGGLVQIPCIERNAVAAVKAINAARLSLWGDGRHRVSLDAVVETMRQTGLDMNRKYKETAEGGLAVNVVEC